MQYSDSRCRTPPSRQRQNSSVSPEPLHDQAKAQGTLYLCCSVSLCMPRTCVLSRIHSSNCASSDCSPGACCDLAPSPLPASDMRPNRAPAGLPLVPPPPPVLCRPAGPKTEPVRPASLARASCAWRRLRASTAWSCWRRRLRMSARRGPAAHKRRTQHTTLSSCRRQSNEQMLAAGKETAASGACRQNTLTLRSKQTHAANKKMAPGGVSSRQHLMLAQMQHAS